MNEPKPFLGYRHLDVHFIYGFLWRSDVAIPDSLFVEGFGPQYKGWKAPLLHERVIGSAGADHTEEACIGAYQPTFVLGRCCLETSGLLGSAKGPKAGLAWLVVPMKPEVPFPIVGKALPGKKQDEEDEEHVESLQVTVSWTLRIFSTGTGTFTVRIMTGSIEPGERGFRAAHWLLHLAPNLDTFPEKHPDALKVKSLPATDTFLFTPDFGTFRLFDYFRTQLQNALRTLPGSNVLPKVAGGSPHKEPLFELDERGLAFPFSSNLANPSSLRSAQNIKPTALLRYERKEWRENQAPFAFVTAVVDEESMCRLRGISGSSPASEIASLCTRVAFSNAKLLQEYERFSPDALVALRYDRETQRLLNLCRDDRLFAAFSRRGAVAVTADPQELPALFYVPSLLNLFEILRARLHGAVAVGSRLSQIASKLSTLDTTTSQPIDEAEYAELHRKVVANLQDPLQYLFDGGSLTDLATEANADLFVSNSWSNVRRAFEALDRLLTTWETVRFRRRHGGPNAD